MPDPSERAEKREPTIPELKQEIADLGRRVVKIEGILEGTREIVDEQATLMETLTKDARSASDPRTAMALAILTTISQDPFNTSAWDRARGMLREIQDRFPTPDDLANVKQRPNT